MNVFIFEGPQHEKLRGWRTYQLRLGNGRQSSFLSEPKKLPAMVASLKAEFFAAGEWEAELPTWICPHCAHKGFTPGLHGDAEGRPCSVAMQQRFPLPRAEILERLCGGTANHKLAGQAQA